MGISRRILRLNQEWNGRILAGGTLAIGESYMDEWWDCQSLDQFIDWVLRAGLNKKI